VGTPVTSFGLSWLYSSSMRSTTLPSRSGSGWKPPAARAVFGDLEDLRFGFVEQLASVLAGRVQRRRGDGVGGGDELRSTARSRTISP